VDGLALRCRHADMPAMELHGKPSHAKLAVQSVARRRGGRGRGCLPHSRTPSGTKLLHCRDLKCENDFARALPEDNISSACHPIEFKQRPARAVRIRARG